MELVSSFLIILIALEHLGFLYLEMFLWTKSPGRKIESSGGESRFI